MKKHVVYISGPMTGYVDFNFAAFHEAEAKLRAAGHDVINPATTGGIDTEHIKNPTWHDYMISAIDRMKSATAIHYLIDHEKSPGARIEAIIAEREKLQEVSI